MGKCCITYLLTTYWRTCKFCVTYSFCADSYYQFVLWDKCSTFYWTNQVGMNSYLLSNSCWSDLIDQKGRTKLCRKRIRIGTCLFPLRHLWCFRYCKSTWFPNSWLCRRLAIAMLYSNGWCGTDSSSMLPRRRWCGWGMLENWGIYISSRSHSDFSTCEAFIILTFSNQDGSTCAATSCGRFDLPGGPWQLNLHTPSFRLVVRYSEHSAWSIADWDGLGIWSIRM